MYLVCLAIALDAMIVHNMFHDCEKPYGPVPACVQQVVAVSTLMHLLSCHSGRARISTAAA